MPSAEIIFMATIFFSSFFFVGSPCGGGRSLNRKSASPWGKEMIAALSRPHSPAIPHETESQSQSPRHKNDARPRRRPQKDSLPKGNKPKQDMRHAKQWLCNRVLHKFCYFWFLGTAGPCYLGVGRKKQRKAERHTENRNNAKKGISRNNRTWIHDRRFTRWHKQICIRATETYREWSNKNQKTHTTLEK